MDIQLVQLQPMRVAMLRHQGSYEAIGEKFEMLYSWVKDNGLPVQRMLGVYWDNPELVPENRLRSAACVEVPRGYTLQTGGVVPVEDSEIAGGNYGTTRYVGPYEGLGAVWANLTQQLEGPMNQIISENPSFEIYINDPSDTDPSELITELYMPVK